MNQRLSNANPIHLLGGITDGRVSSSTKLGAKHSERKHDKFVDKLTHDDTENKSFCIKSAASFPTIYYNDNKYITILVNSKDIIHISVSGELI